MLYLFLFSSAYDRNVDNFAASASAADKQSNDRSSQAKQSNAANQAARDKFGRDAANSNQLWANQRAFNKKLDSSNQAKQQAVVGKNYASGFNQVSRIERRIRHDNEMYMLNSFYVNYFISRVYICLLYTSDAADDA